MKEYGDHNCEFRKSHRCYTGQECLRCNGGQATQKMASSIDYQGLWKKQLIKNKARWGNELDTFHVIKDYPETICTIKNYGTMVQHFIDWRAKQVSYLTRKSHFTLKTNSERRKRLRYIEEEQPFRANKKENFTNAAKTFRSLRFWVPHVRVYGEVYDREITDWAQIRKGNMPNRDSI